MTQQPDGTGAGGTRTRRYSDSGSGSHRGSPNTLDDLGDVRAVREYEYLERDLIVPIGTRIRGGPIWSGFVVALATWILLELALFALDLGALAANVLPSADSATWWWSGLAAVISFFLGGLVAGASIAWKGFEDGVLSGIIVWSTIVVTLIVLSAAGAGIGFGVFGDLLATTPSLADADSSAISDAQTASAAALLALAVTLLAAAVGGAVGSKVWPRNREVIDLRQKDSTHY